MEPIIDNMCFLLEPIIDNEGNDSCWDADDDNMVLGEIKLKKTQQGISLEI